MAFSYRIVEERRLACGHASGLVRPEDIISAVDFAFSARILEPSMDRIVLVDPAARLYLLDFHALTQVRDHVLAHERSDGTEASFQVALVVSCPVHEGIARLYRAVWEILELPGVRLTVTRSPARALSALGYPLSTPLPWR